LHNPLTQALLQETDLLLCNKEEACEFAGTSTVEDALDVFVRQGVRTVCVTDGARGAVARQGNRMEHCPAATVNVIDTTGAGDAFCTGMTWSLLQHQDLSECLRTGTILSASVVGRIGAQAGLLTDIEIRQRL
jgi:sugar/nucleoside kinase (ribokinase family)